MRVVVRKARYEDADALAELAAEFAAANPSASREAASDLQCRLTAVTKLLSSPHVSACVAELAGTVAGCVVSSWLPSLVHGGRLLVFVDLVVVKRRFRRRGVGKELMNAAVESAKEMGAYKVVLTTREDNREALAFYRASGLQPNGLAMACYVEAADTAIPEERLGAPNKANLSNADER